MYICLPETSLPDQSAIDQSATFIWGSLSISYIISLIQKFSIEGRTFTCNQSLPAVLHGYRFIKELTMLFEAYIWPLLEICFFTNYSSYNA